MDNQILSQVRAAGIVGAGGAGFPTHVKLAATADTIVVNGAECEPLLRVDQQLMEQLTEKMITGLLAAMEVTGAKEALIALKGKYKQAISALEEQIAGKPIKIKILDDFYPAGDEHVTVYESSGRLVPQGGIPLKVNCVVLNVETLVNIADAMAGKPVTHTYVTITGEVPQPLTLKLPIGISVAEAIALGGRTDLTGMKVIDGGPMMGKFITDFGQPITKTTKGLIVLPQHHALVRRRTLSVEKIVKQAKTACMQCRYCTDLCPRYLLGHHLEPHKIMQSIRYMNLTEDTMKMAFACSECGVCEQYACIMGLSPREVNAFLKRELTKAGSKPNQAPLSQARHSMQPDRKIPVKRMISRLGLASYDKYAPLKFDEYAVNEVRIPLKQHVGAPSQPCVSQGQPVRQGELIAAIPDNALGANIHASINGVVTAVTTTMIVINAREGSQL